MALPNSQTSIQAAPWSRLRAWIDDKEAWERQNNQPAPLTTKELAAISTLVPLNEEPSVGDQDYISRLMREFFFSSLLLPRILTFPPP